MALISHSYLLDME